MVAVSPCEMRLTTLTCKESYQDLPKRRLELADAAVLRKWPQALQHRSGIGEIGVRFLESRGHGGSAGNRGIQQRAGVCVGEVAEPVPCEGRRTDGIVVDQIADARIGEALGAAVIQPNSMIAHERRFHQQVSKNLALQGDVPLKHARRPSHVRIHQGRCALYAAAGDYIQAGIVGRAKKNVLVENQRLGHSARCNIVPG